MALIAPLFPSLPLFLSRSSRHAPEMRRWLLVMVSRFPARVVCFLQVSILLIILFHRLRSHALSHITTLYILMRRSQRREIGRARHILTHCTRKEKRSQTFAEEMIGLVELTALLERLSPGSFGHLQCFENALDASPAAQGFCSGSAYSLAGESDSSMKLSSENQQVLYTW